MQKHNLKKLIIWQQAMDLCDLVYSYTESLPNKEKFNLISQMQRCSVSIPSNIAEGSAKRTELHFAEYLTTSLASGYELETQILICERRKYRKKIDLEKLFALVIELQSKIFNFREKIINEKK